MSKYKKKITIDDIAKLAKVSKTTVSRYLNEKYEFMSSETKKRIEKIISKHNYRPSNIARSLKTRHTNLVGFVVSDIQKSYASPLIKSISRNLRDNKFHMITTSSDNCPKQEKNAIEALIEQQVDAIFLNPVSYSRTKIFDTNTDIPIILIEGDITSQEVDYVCSDAQISMNETIEHLKRSGFSDIYLFIHQTHEDIFSFRRVKAFKNSMSAYGDEADLSKYIKVVPSNSSKDVKSVVSKILASSIGVPVIIAIDDKMLLSLLSIIGNENLRMPYQIGLIGYNDLGVLSNESWLELASVPVSVLVPNWDNLAKEAIKLMQYRLSKPSGVRKKIITDVAVILNKSTKLKTSNY